MTRGSTRAIAPADVEAGAVFDALETARVEALGARAMGGVRDNLAHLTEARVRGDAIVRARTAEEVPLATAVGADRPRAADGRGAAQGRAARAEARRSVDRGESRGRARCAGLTLDDQAAFARLSRRLLEDLDLAAAEEPIEEEPEEGGDDEEGEEGGGDDTSEEGEEGAPAAATSRCAAKRSRTGSAEGSTEEMEPGDEEDGRRRRSQRKHVRLARTAQLGAFARDRLQGVHHALRRDRRGRGAVRRGGARRGSAPTSTSRWAACRTSSPASPTGFSGGCSRSRRGAGISTRRRGCSTPRGWRA